MNVVAKIEIVLMDNGAINVNGAIDNKLMAYGLLDLAKEAIAKHHEEQAKLVKLAPAGMSLVPPKN